MTLKVGDIVVHASNLKQHNEGNSNVEEVVLESYKYVDNDTLVFVYHRLNKSDLDKRMALECNLHFVRKPNLEEKLKISEWLIKYHE